MDFLNGFLISAAFSIAVSPVTAYGTDSTMLPTSSESKMIAYMKERGVNHFLMLSKHRGQILYIVNNQITDSNPALSGKLKGDTLRQNLGVTPSGIFKMEPLGDSDSISFKRVQGTNIYYAIHPVLDIPLQHRTERLQSRQPEWRRISSGCVNVELETISRIRGLMSMPQTFRDSQTERQVSGSFFVVLPEAKAVESIFKFPEINEP